MSKLKHTPGPWRVDSGGDFVIDEDGCMICQTFNREDEDFYNQEPNTRLIATAPEMIEVLIKCYKSVKENYTYNYDCYSPPLDDLEELIEKAKGLSIEEVLSEAKEY